MDRMKSMVVSCWIVLVLLAWGVLGLHSFSDASIPYWATLRNRNRPVAKKKSAILWTHTPECRVSRNTKEAGLYTFARAQQFHRKNLVFDWHVDTLYHMTKSWYDFRKGKPGRDLDVGKMRQSGIGVQVFVMWVPPRMAKHRGGSWRHLRLMHRNFGRLLRSTKGVLEHARTVADIKRIRKQGKIAALLAIEGAHPLEGKLSRVKTIAEWGVVYLGLTWNNSNPFATSAKDEWYRKGYRKRGLTPKGRRLVRLLERYRILVDLSHSGRKTFWDVVRMAKRPFLASHSDSYVLRPHYRNLSDAQLRAIKKHNGVVGANFYTLFLRKGRKHGQATTRDVVRHIAHMVKVAGIDHVSLGSDFDGIRVRPRGLEHIGKLPNLTRELWKHGFRLNALRKILGANSMRVLGAP